MSIGRTVKLDIETRFKPHVIKEVYHDIGLNYRESIRETNRKSLDPDGSGREPLSDSSPYFYARNKLKDVGSDEPDLIYTERAEQSLNVYNTKDSYSFAKASKYYNMYNQYLPANLRRLSGLLATPKTKPRVRFMSLY